MSSLQLVHRTGNRFVLAALCAVVSLYLAACTKSSSRRDTTPPTAPTGLGATAASGTRIDLAWTAATDDVGVTGYRVERCQGAGCANFAQVATPTTTSFSDTGLSGGTSYRYRVAALDAIGNFGAYSNVASATTLLLPPPAAPTGVNATPGNRQAILSWQAVAGATSYNVYSSATSPVTTGGTKTTVSSPGATLSALTNGTPVYAAVTAVTAGGESPLSSGVCAVPTTANTSGLTLYDPLCGDTLDGQKWRTPQFSLGVAGGAMVLSAQASNAESRTVESIFYQTLVNVNTASRVTTLTADITVPSLTASHTGTAEIRAIARLSYQPPANRLQFPGANLNNMAMEVGLHDNGGGLRVVRTFRHCDNASCTSRSATGITFADPAAFITTSEPGQIEAPAAYDTTYTVSISLNETTNVLTWSINGGTFSAATGTADPSVYLAGNTQWTALGANPLGTGGGFLSAQLGARVFDDSSAGGSAGAVAGRFQNVQVGLNTAAASLWDDFSGTGGNSGANGELILTKWALSGSPFGSELMALSAGSLTGHAQATSPSTSGFSSLQGILLNNPAVINTLQADMTATACSNTAPISGGANLVEVQGTFFNDGSPGTTAPDINQPNSLVGDVRAVLQFDCVFGTGSLIIVRLNTQTTSTIVSPLTAVPLGSVPVGGTHTLRLKWDPLGHTFTFQIDDGTPVVVDPTLLGGNVINAVNIAGPANAPQKLLGWRLIVPASVSPSSAGATASLGLKANNVFTAP